MAKFIFVKTRSKSLSQSGASWHGIVRFVLVVLIIIIICAALMKAMAYTQRFSDHLRFQYRENRDDKIRGLAEENTVNATARMS